MLVKTYVTTAKATMTNRMRAQCTRYWVSMIHFFFFVFKNRMKKFSKKTKTKQQNNSIKQSPQAKAAL